MLAAHGVDGHISFKRFNSFIEHIVCPSPRATEANVEPSLDCGPLAARRSLNDAVH